MIDLKSIKPSIEIKPPKIVLYGPSGIGKSTFAAQAPNPLVIDVEGGMNLINVAKHKVKSFEEMMETLVALSTQDHNFQYVVVDSIDWLERIMIRYLCSTNNAKTINDPNCKAFSFGRGEKLLMTLWERFINALNSLHATKNMGIILIAHNQITKFNDPMTESYDKHSLKLEKRSGEFVKEWAECILFADLKVKIEEEEVGFKNTVNRGKEVGRVLYTEKRPAFEAKNRYGLLPEIDFSWKSFIKHVNKRHDDLSSAAILQKDQVIALRDLLQQTSTDEENFVNFIIENKNMRPFGDLKLENLPNSGFDEMERLLIKKMEKVNAAVIPNVGLNSHHEGVLAYLSEMPKFIPETQLNGHSEGTMQ